MTILDLESRESGRLILFVHIGRCIDFKKRTSSKTYVSNRKY
jgi:hypothetical protein